MTRIGSQLKCNDEVENEKGDGRQLVFPVHMLGILNARNLYQHHHSTLDSALDCDISNNAATGHLIDSCPSQHRRFSLRYFITSLKDIFLVGLRLDIL